MKVFVSWSGELSKEIAEILRINIQALLQEIDVFFSPYDIAKGDNWDRVISENLNDCRHGIICLTKDNISAPWINFEAGALAKSLDSKVTALMINIQPSDIQGPLSRYQATALVKDDFWKLLNSLNKDLTKPVPDTYIKVLFDAVWPKMNEAFKAALSKHETSEQGNFEQTNVVSYREEVILEEILRMTRQMSVSMEGLYEQLPKTYSAISRMNSGSDRKKMFPYKKIQIGTGQQFAEEIAPNRIISFIKGEYCTTDIEFSGPFVSKEDVFDGNELVINDVDHLYIQGNGTSLTARPRYAQVLMLKNCRDVIIDGFEMGHTPDRGSCSGDVIQLQNCQNVHLHNLSLYGCGTYGIGLKNCSDIFVEDVKIFRCTYGALRIIDSECIISDLEIYECSNVFDLIDCQNSILIISNGYIHDNNQVGDFIRKSNSQIIFSNTKVSNSSFKESINTYDIEGVEFDSTTWLPQNEE